LLIGRLFKVKINYC